jgi:hypothetical protein
MKKQKVITFTGTKLADMKKHWAKQISKFIKKSSVMSDQILPIVLTNEENYIQNERNGGAFPSDVKKKDEKRIYALICDVFSRLAMPNLVSVQPMDAPVGLVFFTKKVRENSDNSVLPQISISVNSEPAGAKSVRLNTLSLFGDTKRLPDDNLGIPLGETRRRTDTFIYQESVKSLATEIDRFIIKELISGVIQKSPSMIEVSADYCPGDNTFDLKTAANNLFRNCLSEPKWILGSPQYVQLILRKDLKLRPDIFLAGNAFGMDVWCDAFFPHAALIGSVGDNAIDNGCVWSPYIPLVFLPSCLDPGASPIARNFIRHSVTVTDPSRFMLLTDRKTAEALNTQKIVEKESLAQANKKESFLK